MCSFHRGLRNLSSCKQIIHATLKTISGQQTCNIHVTLKIILGTQTYNLCHLWYVFCIIMKVLLAPAILTVY